jgi:hypothetical protein
MRLRHVYLGLCLLGAILPFSQFLPWLAAHGLDVSLFFSELFSTRIGAFFGMDVLVSALVLFTFIAVEGRRLAMRRLWLPVLATIAVGVSLGLPLFLYMRANALDATTPRASAA